MYLPHRRDFFVTTPISLKTPIKLYTLFSNFLVFENSHPHGISNPFSELFRNFLELHKCWKKMIQTILKSVDLEHCKGRHTLHIWLTTPNKLKGISPFQMRKFLILFITLSTCILKPAICCVHITSSADIWLFLPRKGGMYNFTPSGKMSWIWNTLSAMMLSLSSNFCDKKPLRRTISRSEMLPV